MADADSLVRCKMDPQLAKLINGGSYTVNDLVMMGVHAELATVIANQGTTEELMACGLPALLATEVKAVIG